MKLTLNKSIEAKKLNRRTGLPATEPESTIPYGAIVDYQGPDGSQERFLYIGELFRCNRDVLASALEGGSIPQAAAGEPEAPVRIVEPVAAKARLDFEALHSSHHAITRARIPGGWLVCAGGTGITFVPDAAHEWNGASME